MSSEPVAHGFEDAVELAARYLGARPSSQELESTGSEAALARAGLVARDLGSPRRFVATDLPALCEVDGAWHLIVEPGSGKLVVALGADGAPMPMRLRAKPTRAYAVNAITAPAAGALPDTITSEPGLLKHGLLRLLLPSRSVLTVVVAATCAINVLALAIPIATMNIFDRVLTNNASETLFVLASGVVLALLFDFVLRGLRAGLLDRASAATDIGVVTDVFERLVDARGSIGSVGNRTNALREYEGLREYFNAAALATLGDLPFLFIFVGVMFWIAGPLAWVPVISGAGLLVIMALVQLRVRHLVKVQFQASATKNTVATELLAAIPTIQLAGAKRWARLRWEKAAGDQLRQSLKLRFWTAFSTHLLVVFQGGTTIAILVLGAQAVMAAELSPGALFAANLLAARCLAPIAGLAGLAARFSQMKLSHEQIRDIAALPGETPATQKTGSGQPAGNAISIVALTHRYALEGAPALTAVDLAFKRGEWTAIIGAIGSGKTTLLDSLSGRLVPAEGSVRLDGLDLQSVKPGHWRRVAGFVPQAPSFFAGTVRENIDLGRGFSDDAIWTSLTSLGADAWLERTGKGLDVALGERGHGLSGGQLQTLALARAMIGEPRWLILDEPTNHLDGQSEALAVRSLEATRGQSTLIAVTHRPAIIEAADRLIVMEAGRVKLDGPRGEVLETLRGITEQARIQTRLTG
ncbi:MAG: ATP-binding cassette domain-containing protein [Pseudomonadota bacterium]